jgi:hypothetical protein
VALATRHAIPPFTTFVKASWLGADELWRKFAETIIGNSEFYASRILKATARTEAGHASGHILFAINLVTTKALGLEVPRRCSPG